MDGVRGLPLLSGPPPQMEDSSDSCRKCNKEFNRIFNRARRCNHCGYLYCSSCCEHSALMPRIGVYNGFDPVDVCSYCIEVLRVTAMSRAQLRGMPLSHLKAYMSAYGLAAPPHAVEKDEYVIAIIDARGANGCLPKANEDYYRKRSIPQPSGERPRGFLARLADNFADLVERLPQPDANSTGPPPVPPRPNPSWEPPRNAGFQRPPAPPPRPQPGPSGQQTSPRPAPPPQPRRPSPNAQPRPQTQPPPQPSPQRPAPQPLPVEQLLEMAPEDISRLSIGVLKAILNQNHVRIPQDALEKRDLVERVVTLLDASRVEKERDTQARAAEEAEEQAEIEAQIRAFEEREKAKTGEQTAEGFQSSSEKPTSGESELHSHLPQAARTAAAKLERDGLCVICQDEDANIAIVDCGHLCLCMGCSELVMSSSKECPLCRTRIVTSQRLLRIFKT